MAFEEVVRRPVYVQVAEQLRDAILEGDLEAGAALPPERELSERFGVSRTTVREALRALQAQGLVVAGGPTAPLRVTHPEALSTGALSEGLGHLLRLGRVPLLDLVELRCALEGEALRRAARTAPAPDLEPADAAIAAMHEAAGDVVAFERADVAFHLALVKASGNEAIALTMLAVRDSIAAHLLDALRRPADPSPTLARLTAEHEGLLAAVRAGDADAAAGLVREHIMGLYERSLDR